MGAPSSTNGANHPSAGAANRIASRRGRRRRDRRLDRAARAAAASASTRSRWRPGPADAERPSVGDVAPSRRDVAGTRPSARRARTSRASSQPGDQRRHRLVAPAVVEGPATIAALPRRIAGQGDAVGTNAPGQGHPVDVLVHAHHVERRGQVPFSIGELEPLQVMETEREAGPRAVRRALEAPLGFERQRRVGVAAGVVDPPVPQRDQAAHAGGLDHGARREVLARTARASVSTSWATSSWSPSRAARAWNSRARPCRASRSIPTTSG